MAVGSTTTVGFCLGWSDIQQDCFYVTANNRKLALKGTKKYTVEYREIMLTVKCASELQNHVKWNVGRCKNTPRTRQNVTDKPVMEN